MVKKKDVLAGMLDELKGDGVSLVSDGGLSSDIPYTCTTGSMVLDALFLNGDDPESAFCSAALIPFGRVVSFNGKPKLGKTTLAATMMRAVQQSGLDINGHEPIVAILDTEQALSKAWFIKNGVDVSRLLNFPLTGKNNTIANAARAIKKIIDKRNNIDKDSPLLIVWDSIGATSSDVQVENLNKDIGEDVKGSYGKSKSLGEFLMPLKDYLAEYNVCLVVINHVYTSMDGRGADRVSGGNKLGHVESIRVVLKKPAINHKLHRSKGGKKFIYGQQVRVESQFNKIHPPDTVGKTLSIVWDEAVSDHHAVYDAVSAKKWTSPGGDELKWRNYEEFRARAVQHAEYLSLYNTVRQEVYKLRPIESLPYRPAAEITGDFAAEDDAD